jgi:hypothetical protein
MLRSTKVHRSMRARGRSRAAGYDYGAKLIEQTISRYDKTRDGPALFRLLDLAAASTPCGPGYGSASLADLLQAVQT